MTRNLFALSLLSAAVLAVLPQEVQAATLNMGPAGTPYSYAGHTRGYWFTAPVDFTITGLRVPEYTGSQSGPFTQNIQVMRYNGTGSLPTSLTAASSNHTTLFYTSTGSAGNDFISVNIPITNGDLIVILGTRGTVTMHNMYGAANDYVSSLDGNAVTLQRVMYQSNLHNLQAGAIFASTGLSFARVEMTYETNSIDVDGDGYYETSDCDDNDPAINPGATDLVGDGIDNNCDGIDGDDADGDAHASVASGGDDCDDAAAATYPGNTEVCDGIDNNCLGGVDEGFDLDGDGVSTCGPDGVAGNSDDDCDDGAATNYPGNTELCDGLDNDCNGSADFGTAGEADGDGDGSASCDDCDDADAANFLGNPEVCDGQDNDCNGLSDFDLLGETDGDGDGTISCADCDDAVATIFPGAGEACDGLDSDCDPTTEAIGGEADDDNDGAFSCDDCDDTDASVFPGNTEICDGLDSDCDPATEAAGGESDSDGDGVASCLDCDDSNAAIFAGHPELCDSLDNDCDPDTDEDADTDGDGQSICDDDCDDDDDRRFAGNPEICDLVDNDCDETTQEDVDGDGDGDSVCDGDCDDANDAIGPEFVFSEICDDGFDNNCDGFADQEDTECQGSDDDDDDGGDDDDGDPAAARGACLCSGSSLLDPTPRGALLLLLLMGLLPLRRRR